MKTILKVECYASAETSGTEEKNVSYEQLKTIHERLPKGDVTTMKDGLNDKVRVLSNTLLHHVMEKGHW